MGSRRFPVPDVRLPRATRWLGLALALPWLIAASPSRPLSLQVPGDTALPVPAPTPLTPLPPKFAPAPLPNRDLEAPSGPRASNDPSFSPNLITRGDTYRGDALSKGSSAQAEQDKRVKPGAGLNLTVPFSPN